METEQVRIIRHNQEMREQSQRAMAISKALEEESKLA
jgi:hypothetical protein